MRQSPKYYTVQKEDIGKGSMVPVAVSCTCGECSAQTYPFEPLGRVISNDVGKRLSFIDGLWYAENHAQFFARLMQKAQEDDICCLGCGSVEISPVVEQPWKMECKECHCHFTPDYEILQISI